MNGTNENAAIRRIDRQLERQADDDYDFEDVDCESCGMKFYVRPSLYAGTDKLFPTQCERCRKGLPPLYEY